MPETKQQGERKRSGEAADLKTDELDGAAGGLHFVDSVRTARKGVAIQQGRVALDADYNE